MIYETDTDLYYSYTGAAWIQAFAIGQWASWTPVLQQPGTVTKTVNYARYQKIGRLLVGSYFLTVTGTGTGANLVAVSLPSFTLAAAALSVHPIGSGYVYDSSASTYYNGTLALSSGTTAGVLAGTSATAFVGASVMTAALASGDVVAGTFSIEVTT